MHGEIYGIDHNMKRFQFDQAMKARAKTPIPGLYLTGERNAIGVASIYRYWKAGPLRKKMCWYETCFGPPHTLILIKSFISFSVPRRKDHTLSSLFYIIPIHHCN